MTKRFDALLFDAGGIFVVPDPLTTGMILEPFGGATSLSVLVRCHYAGMAAIDAATASQAADSIERISWSSYREAYAREAGVPEQKVAEAAVALLKVFSAFLWHFPLHESVAGLWRLHLLGIRIGITPIASSKISGSGFATPTTCESVTINTGTPEPSPT